MVTDDEDHFGMLNAARDRDRMEEAFMPLGLFRRFRFRKERNESGGKLRRVYHLSFGGPRMNGNSREGYPGSGGVKGLAFEPADIAAVNREPV
jgi:hypothetical protein